MSTTEEYVKQSSLVYLGNKRKLVEWIEEAVERVKLRLGKDKLVVVDAFCGSTSVARMLAGHASELHTNDFERYSHVLQVCYVQPLSAEQAERVRLHVEAVNARMSEGPLVTGGLVALNYAPADTEDAKEGERMFFTHENAVRIDTARDYVERSVEPELRPYVLGPLLVQCSTSANSMGYFQAAYKTWGGGSGPQKRTMKPLELPQPVLNPHAGCAVTCHQRDALALLRELAPPAPGTAAGPAAGTAAGPAAEGVRGALPPVVDLVYLDPPYNGKSYGSYYGFLNVLCANEMPAKVTATHGVPCDWQRSEFYRKRGALPAFKELVAATMRCARCAIFSYSDEGHISRAELDAALEGYQVEVLERAHMRFANPLTLKLKQRKTSQELLFIVYNV